jgi:hypothetical protein
VNDARKLRGAGSPWLLAVPFGVLVVYQVGAAWHFHDAAGRQAETVGMITSFVRGNHASLPYAYTVAGLRYEGRYYPGAETIKLKPSVTVYYDRANPAVSGLLDFDHRATVAAGPAIFVMFIGSLIGAVFALHGFLRRRSK